MFDARGAINFHRAFRLIVVSFFYGIIMLQAITNASPRDVNGERLSISIIGDHQVGTNAVGIWISSGKVRVSLSNAFDKNFDGAGVVEAPCRFVWKATLSLGHRRRERAGRQV
ncbi:hypothetical protein, partial [Burkholderia vietnamiensis]|uniref:hypothetical protein n=1 Tax=Burkholderia vietnamiensis TaxID=60552 RepID=UPI001E4C0601